jgi:hypothetical protein
MLAHDRWKEWWLETRKSFRKRELRAFYTFVILVQGGLRRSLFARVVH